MQFAFENIMEFYMNHMGNNINSKIILEGMNIGDFILLLKSEIINSIDKNKMQHAKELLSIQDCALKRGVSVQTIRNWMKLHDIKRYRMGRRVFLDYNEIISKLSGD